jgi:hypothetical protein
MSHRRIRPKCTCQVRLPDVDFIPDVRDCGEFARRDRRHALLQATPMTTTPIATHPIRRRSAPALAAAPRVGT